MSLWAQQMPDLLQHFQVLRYDTRGHGASDAPAGAYSIEQLGRDALGLADALKIAQFAFCGVSLGGMIGQWLGVNAAPSGSPRWFSRIRLRDIGPKTFWDDRRRAVLEGGMAAIADGAMQRFFSRETLADGNVYASSIRAVILWRPIRLDTRAAARRFATWIIRRCLRQIRVPTLVIVGEHDVSTPWVGHGEVLARAIPARARSICRQRIFRMWSGRDRLRRRSTICCGRARRRGTAPIPSTKALRCGGRCWAMGTWSVPSRRPPISTANFRN